MKAILLAAGLGTRLRPLTDTIPKCLVPIQGRPLLEWWLELLKKHGVQEVLINTHYLSEQVHAWLEAYRGRTDAVQVTEYYEKTLLGSGGTVRENRAFVGSEPFFICYADNFTSIDLGDMLAFHNSHSGLLTMALFHAAHPQQCGIAQLDDRQRIVDFVEKPAVPKSDWSNAGVYITDGRIFEHIPTGESIDFGMHVLPRIIGRMYGWPIIGQLIDVGTPENYKRAQTIKIEGQLT